MLGQRTILTMLLMVATLSVFGMNRDTRPYRCEVGLQAGLGYYVGDATSHIFQNVREVYGGHFRYKFDPRWSLTLKGLQQTAYIPQTLVRTKEGMVMTEAAKRHWGNIDVTAEFNFFRMGQYQYDRRYKPFSPYIFLGIGTMLYPGENGRIKAAAYLPFGIGFKWMFHARWGVFWAWQHNLVFADDIEGRPLLGNTWGLNGGNFMNCDLTGQMTIGVVFSFAQVEKVCRTCR